VARRDVGKFIFDQDFPGIGGGLKRGAARGVCEKPVGVKPVVEFDVKCPSAW
jgi:hypothetical protein